MSWPDFDHFQTHFWATSCKANLDFSIAFARGHTFFLPTAATNVEYPTAATNVEYI